MPHDSPTSEDLRDSADRAATGGEAPAGDEPGHLARNVERVLHRIHEAAAAADREPPSLVAVTKSVDAVTTAALVRSSGVQDLAENRAQRLVDKAMALGALDPAPVWHFIGHLQRNKVRRVLEHAHVLHSVDSLRLAEAVVRISGELQRTIDVFVEVNLTGEPEKHGHFPDELEPTLDALAASDHVRVLGLMAMGPLAGRGARSTKEVFADAAALAARVEAERGAATFHQGRCQLSMGMSGDLELAVAHGSTHVRVGSALFQGVDPSHRL